MSGFETVRRRKPGPGQGNGPGDAGKETAGRDAGSRPAAQEHLDLRPVDMAGGTETSDHGLGHATRRLHVLRLAVDVQLAVAHRDRDVELLTEEAGVAVVDPEQGPHLVRGFDRDGGAHSG